MPCLLDCEGSGAGSFPAVERVVYSLGSRQSAAVCLPPAAALSHMGLGKGKALLHSACWFLSSTPLLPHTCP